eukprot:scaffold171294_cov18-Tisochrysis_lutea.AAC.1
MLMQTRRSCALKPSTRRSSPDPSSRAGSRRSQGLSRDQQKLPLHSGSFSTGAAVLRGMLIHHIDCQLQPNVHLRNRPSMPAAGVAMLSLQEGHKHACCRSPNGAGKHIGPLLSTALANMDPVWHQ